MSKSKTSCALLTPPVERVLTALTADTAPQFEPFTPWMPATGIDAFRAVISPKAVSGNFVFKAAWQSAAVRTDAPAGWIAVGASWSPSTLPMNTGSVAIDTSQATWVRFGVAYANGASAGFGTASLTEQVSAESCGQQVGTWSGALQTQTTTQTFQPVSAWVPAVHAAKVKLTFVISGAVGNFQCTAAFQTADFVPDAPDAWSTAWATGPLGAPYVGNIEGNTGEMVGVAGAVFPGSGWVRFGLAYSLTSGTALGQADVTAVTSLRSV